MSEIPQSPGSVASTRPYEEDEVSLLDILLVLARNKQLILRVVALFTVLGIGYALLAPSEYTSTTRVVREAQAEGGSALGGLSALRGFGVNLGGASGGLTPEAYPDILTSREVRLAVVRDTFYFPGAGRHMTFVDYVHQPTGLLGTVARYTIGLPWTLKRALFAETPAPVTATSGETVYPTEEEEEAIEAIRNMVSSSLDTENGLMAISVTAHDPVFAARLAERFLVHLTERIRALRTEKARRNLAFIEDRFEEVKEDLARAEERLAQFMDRNKQITSEQLRVEQERLQRQVRFASNLYGELQTQRTQAEIELQRSEPVVTVVEEPVPPVRRSAPKRTLIVLLSLILGGFVGTGAAFVKSFLDSQEEHEEERKKLEEIRARLVPEELIARVTARWRRSEKETREA